MLEGQTLQGSEAGTLPDTGRTGPAGQGAPRGRRRAGSRNLHSPAATDRLPPWGNPDPEMGVCGFSGRCPATAGLQDWGQGRTHRQSGAGRAVRHIPDRGQSLRHHRKGGRAVSDRHPETVAAAARKSRTGHTTHPRPAPLLCIGCTPTWRGPDHDRAVIGSYAGADHRAVCPSQDRSRSHHRQQGGGRRRERSRRYPIVESEYRHRCL